MRFLRQVMAAILMVAFAGYGVTASAPAHAHAADEFHAVHVIAVDTHDRSHHTDGPEHDDHGPEAVDVSGADHDETDLHAHGAPHFNDADAPIFLIAADVADAALSSVLSTLPTLQRAAPPFKPPRSFL